MAESPNDSPPPYSDAVGLESPPPYTEAGTWSGQATETGPSSISNQIQSQQRSSPPPPMQISQQPSGAQLPRHISQQRRSQNIGVPHRSSNGGAVRHTTLVIREKPSPREQPGRVLYLPSQSASNVDPNFSPSQAGQHTVVVTQTRPAVQHDYLPFSILVAIFCFLPTGIAAIAKSCLAMNAYGRGDLHRGRSHASCARVLAITSLGIGIFLWGIPALFFLVFFLTFQG